MPKILELSAVAFTYEKFIHPLALYFRSRNWIVNVSFNPSSFYDLNFLKTSSILFTPVQVFRSVKLNAILQSIFSLFLLLRSSDEDILHIHTPLLSYYVRFLFLFPFFRRKRKIVYTVHGYFFHSNGGIISNAVHFCLEWLLSFQCSLLLFVSRSDYLFAKKFMPLRDDQLAYIGNGVDTLFFSPSFLPCTTAKSKASFGIDSSDFVVGFVGRFVVEKGVLDLITAFEILISLHPDCKLLMVGGTLESDYDSSLPSLLAALPPSLSRTIVFTGMINSPEVLRSAYYAMDAFCLPSYREGLPTALLEAMACGLPSVCTNIRGCNQLVTHNVNGLLVPPKSPTSIVSALSRLKVSPELRDAFSSAASKHVFEGYDLRSIVSNQYTLIDSLFR